MKRCSACRAEKTLSEFHANKNQPDGLCHACKPCRKVQKAESHQRNREKQLKKFAAWRAANPDKVKANNDRSYREGREKIRAQQNARRRSNPEQYRARDAAYYAANRSRFESYRKRYKVENPERWRAAMAAGRLRYEAAKRTATIQEFSGAELAQRVSVFGDRCAYCAGPFEHLDHLKPIARGGPHCLANFRPACAACNHRKRAKNPFEWLAKLQRLREILPLP